MQGLGVVACSAGGTERGSGTECGEGGREAVGEVWLDSAGLTKGSFQWC